jgi:hypothetical protein
LVEIRDKTGEKRRLLCRVYMCSFAIVCVFCSSFTTIFIYMWSYIIYGFYLVVSWVAFSVTFFIPFPGNKCKPSDTVWMNHPERDWQGKRSNIPSGNFT